MAGAHAARPAPGATRAPVRRPVRPRPVDDRGSSASALTLGVISLMVIFAAFAGAVALRAVIAEQQQQIDGFRQQVDDAELRTTELRVQVAELESPDRIRVAAQVQLGMVEPVETEYLSPLVPGSSPVPLPPPAGDPFAPTPSGATDETDGPAG